VGADRAGTRAGPGAGADLGATLTKLAFRTDDGALRFDLLPSGDPDEAARRIEAARPGTIGLTGAGAAGLSRLLGRDTAPVSEFDAWWVGAGVLLRRQGCGPPERDLVVSLGTGTSILLVEPDRVTRVGGTALGGGTLMGLGATLTGCIDYEELVALSGSGDRRRVDLLVSDIDPDGVIPLPRDLTASSMAKLGRDPGSHAPGDLAQAVVGLVGENVALLTASLAALTGAARVVFAGSTLRHNPVLRDLLAGVTTAAGREVVFLEDGEFAGAVGALEMAADTGD
jgi:type II pantothenate kinase